MVYKNIMTLYVTVNYSECVHVLENFSGSQRHFQSVFQLKVNLVFFHVQKVEQTALGDVFETNYNVRDLGHHSH